MGGKYLVATVMVTLVMLVSLVIFVGVKLVKLALTLSEVFVAFGVVVVVVVFVLFGFVVVTVDVDVVTVVLVVVVVSRFWIERCARRGLTTQAPTGHQPTDPTRRPTDGLHRPFPRHSQL